MRNLSKLTVVGAGAVGTAVAYASIIRGSAQQVCLYDINESKVNAEVADLRHGTQYTPVTDVTGGADPAVTANSDVIVITAGAKQKPGQSRLELAGKNAKILASMLPLLKEYSPNAVWVIVTNPVDVLTYQATKILDLPYGRVLGSGTMLDTSRLRMMLAEEAGVAPTTVHATMMGEHGDTEFPVWSSATIGAVPLREWENHGELVFNDEKLEKLSTSVMRAAYEVIQGKGATNYAVGVASARIVEAILNDERGMFPVSSVLNDYRGISDVALSVPSVVGKRGVDAVYEVPMTAPERKLLLQSAEEIKRSIETIRVDIEADIPAEKES
ncbi:L-lactate dehydrogenase [Actinotignum urinale]|uniref:L-lactate dehydrogenase n=1 Tax=Actinotignum urinale TaxID=190146 RepID=A0AAW9HUQ3_9ACTO|nr:L-lactate dehydrogenase [Actinotignum urinale]MDY5128977.1 L-lactate dehydrogenase [Actinotignum urinale]MDY5132467.1 L-lactate dehydrogenase [Actinotignum urinale]MDY5151049.1 L-lactate dehydrogenase [Actinotignum urinale]MDY5154778.1 L-lactate dehydrogenase [Actinotignum urinale]MDY5159928.1 L-lactate dehydrogenase [Actinotignum urinale]